MNDSRIIFLPVPQDLRELFSENTDGFQINPDIPIPVEIQDIENLSLQKILSGMLHVIETGEADQEWLDYYSRFILFLRPDILQEIKKIRSNDLNDKNYNEALKLIKEGKTEEALINIRNFLEQCPMDWNGWFLLGWALRLLSRWKDGEAALRKAIELGGGGSDIRNELAICLMEQGNIAGAKQELESALKDDPENVKIISNLGVLALKTGDKDKANAFFRTILELDENDPVAKKILEI